MSMSLVPVDTFALVPQAANLAEQIARTDFAPVGLRGKPEAVMAAMLQGHELGIGPMQALSEIAVINGKPCMSSKLMRALVQRAGHEIWFHSKTNTKVVMRARRAEWPEDRVAEVAWTMDDAKAAGLSGGQNYRKYPRQMLAARCTGEICRDNFADVLGGIGYTPEELTDGDLVADDDITVDSRGDIAPDAAATTTRRAAKPAVAKKAPAKKAATAPAPSRAAAAIPVPPLPGEPGFDDPPAAAPVAAEHPAEDIVDAEVIEDDDPPATLAEALEAADLRPGPVLKRARAIAAEHGMDLPLELDGIVGDLLPLVAADMGFTVPSGAAPSTGSDGRNRKMWAMASEVFGDEADAKRKHLIAALTDGRTESSKDLAPAEWDDLFTALEEIGAGRSELHLRSNGAWELRATRGAA